MRGIELEKAGLNQSSGPSLKLTIVTRDEARRQVHLQSRVTRLTAIAPESWRPAEMNFVVSRSKRD